MGARNVVDKGWKREEGFGDKDGQTKNGESYTGWEDEVPLLSADNYIERVEVRWFRRINGRE